jgi:hypothetical protein
MKNQNVVRLKDCMRCEFGITCQAGITMRMIAGCQKIVFDKHGCPQKTIIQGARYIEGTE